MSGISSWIVIIGTLASIVVFYLILQLNRRAERKIGQTTGHEWDGIEEYDNPLPLWWYWMFVLTLVFGIGYLFWYPGLGNFAGIGDWTSDQEVANDLDAMEKQYAPIYASYRERGIEELAADPEVRKMGQRLFANNCIQCHGSAAAGGPGYPNLTDGAWIWGGAPETIEQTILYGRKAVMPAWQGVVPDVAIKDVVAYVRSLSGNEGAPESISAGQSTFMLYCVACHGADGKGNPLLGSADLTDADWLYGGTPANIETSIRAGRQGEMPAFREKLGEDRVHVLAAYVYSLSH